MKLTVTPEDHEKALRIYRKRGRRGDYSPSRSCPIAQALKRTFGTRSAWAAVRTAAVRDQTFTLPESADSWMDQWDNAVALPDANDADFPRIPATFSLVAQERADG